MEDMYQNGQDSYFAPRPTIQPVRIGESSSSEPSPPSPLQRKHRHRPPTPPFLSITPDPNHHINKGNTRDKHASKVHPTQKSDHQAYVRFLSRLRDKEHEEDTLGSRPRSRSRSDSSGSSALPTILRLLAQETTRADVAEQQTTKDTDVLISRLRDMKEAKEKSEAELARVRTELELYKLQLQLAYQEIRRAQSIVDEVEQARAEAEEKGVRDRERIRKMITQRALELAREEGRREGWRQGLEQGRWVAWARNEVEGWDEEEEEEAEEEEEEEEEEARLPNHSLPAPQKPPFHLIPPLKRTIRDNTRQMPATLREGARSAAPDVAPHAKSLPIPTIVTPTPVRIPSTQPQVPGQSRHPENIAIHHQMRAKTASPAHSLRSRPRSPSLAPSRRSHRSTVLPPDGYIPTLGPDEHISLPPPHELSHRVEFDATTAEDKEISGGAPVNQQVDKKGKSRADINEGRERKEPRVRDFAYAPMPTVQQPVREYDSVFLNRNGEGRRTPEGSTVSGGSTRISQYDLVSPPRARDNHRARNGERNVRHAEGNEARGHMLQHATESREAGVGAETRKRTQPEQITQEWSSTNSDVIEMPSPTKMYPREPNTRAATSIYSPRGREVPEANHIDSKSPDLRSLRVNGGPRPPRETAPSVTVPNLPYNGRGNNIYRNIKAEELSGDRSAQSHRPRTPSIYYNPPPANEPPEQPPQSPSRNPFHRSFSNVTVPGISVEPPSRSPTNSSEGTVVDPVLLTPEHANWPTPLPGGRSIEPDQDPASAYTEQQHSPVVVLPSNTLPPGFIPLSPIPTITNFKAGDHDHHRIHEQYQGSGYQIYAGTALVPDMSRNRFGIENISGSGPSSGRAPFVEPPRPSTAGGALSSPVITDNARRRVMSFGASPAPLNRPISLFSDSDH